MTRSSRPSSAREVADEPDPPGGRKARCWTVFSGDLAYQLRRPLFIAWALMLVLMAFGFSSGKVRISSGDAAVGGTKSFITSEFALGFQLSVLTILCYGFFVAVAAGMSIIQDEEWRLGELLHATPLRPREYVWGKLASVLVVSVIALGIHLAAMVFFFHVLPNAEAQDFRGPLSAANYLKPALIFSVPTIVFFAGIAFAAGEWTRRPVAVYLLPVLIVLVEMFFLWDWSPSWLDPRINRALMLIDPSGFRWLNETWLKVDRGVRFYNASPIPPDLGFLASRLALAALGLGAGAVSSRHLAANLRGAKPGRRAARRRATAGADAAAGSVDVRPVADGPADRAANEHSPPGSAGRRVARRPRRAGGTPIEPRPLPVHPPPLADDDEPGTRGNRIPRHVVPDVHQARVRRSGAMGTLATCACLLLMFYAVESLERERTTRLAAILQAAPIRVVRSCWARRPRLAVVAARRSC